MLSGHILATTILMLGVSSAMKSQAQPASLDLVSDAMVISVQPSSGAWTLLDRRSGQRWPSTGTARIASAPAFAEAFTQQRSTHDALGRLTSLTLSGTRGVSASISLVDDGSSVVFSYGGDEISGGIKVFGDALQISAREKGYAIVPCREGLLFPADSGVACKRTFGSSDYEGCHMNMMGFVKNGSALIMDWDDAYVFPELQSVLPTDDEGDDAVQRLLCEVTLRGSARSIRLSPLGLGDWNKVAEQYRRIAEQKGLAITLNEKTRRNQRLALLDGAANVKLWTCLARRMNEDSSAEESVNVRWTFDEAAEIAEHLRHDLQIEKCLFIIGGWTEGGYDCRHPDALPANPECGGNDALAAAVARIQSLGYVAAFHDNYQDMYADAPSWDPAMLEKDGAGNPLKGGRWLGGRAYMVCAPKQYELASRPQNLPAVQKLFGPWCYFIDTTYAVGPRECRDPAHPIDRNSDIAWKQKLSDFARECFGLFGSECGREWALPHSDWFEGLVGVSGRYFHNLEPAKMGAQVIPFWEMVYHDCQVVHGKYGYTADQAAEYVAHHALCARTLHYHSMPDHLYWKDEQRIPRLNVIPSVESFQPDGDQAFNISYSWQAEGGTDDNWRAFVHFVDDNKILFQNDHELTPATSSWQAGQTIKSGPFRVVVPEGIQAQQVKVYLGLFSLSDVSARAKLIGGDGQDRVLVGTLRLKPTLHFTPGHQEKDWNAAAYTRSDDGWADGMHPMDVFIKNTQELLGPINELCTHLRLHDFAYLNAERSLKRAVYGAGEAAVSVTVNMDAQALSVPSRYGGEVLLPPWGVLAEASSFTAFYASRWGGRDYAKPALFCIRAADGKALAQARQLRIFHGLGDPEISWRGQSFTVQREAVVNLP